MAKALSDPIHPGHILRVEFLEELGLTPYKVAKACGVPRTRIERICREERPVTADTAMRLERCFGMSADFWMNMQAAHDLAIARADPPADLDDVERLHEPPPVPAPVTAKETPPIPDKKVALTKKIIRRRASRKSSSPRKGGRMTDL